MKKKYFKILSLFLSLSTIFTSIQPSYAYNMENNNSVETIEYQSTEDEDFSNSLNVFAELASIYKVTIPKTVVLSGESKDASYFVKVEGDIAGYEQISVIPDESFNLYTKKKDPQEAFVSQDKTIWHVSDFDIDANGTIKANTITAGKWSGVFYFNINLEDGEKVAGDIIIPPDLPLDDDYRLIIEKISDAPGLYDDNFTLILPWPEIAKRIEGGETISQIVNSCPGGIYLSIPQGTSIIPTNYLPGTNIRYIYVPETVTTIQTTSCPGSPIKGVFLPKSTKVEPGAFDNTPAGENKQVYVGGQRIVDTIIDINTLPEREEDIKDEDALILEKGCKYQITALYNFYDDVTKESTIKSSNPDIVKFIPDCTLEALEVGTSIISGKYFGPLGERNAYLLVKVIDTGYSKGSIPSNTHKHVVGPLQEENKVLATCTKDGHVDQVFYCSDCNKELGRRTVPLYATGHVAGEWVIVKEATENETGLKEQRCTVCDELLKSEVIEKLPNTDKHTDVKYVYKNRIEPTCTKNGSQDKIAICNVCGKEVEKTTEILPATGHTKGEYKIVKNATCSEKGLKEQRCTVCDELLDSEEIPMTQHIEKSAVRENEIPATCTKDGSYDEVVYCSVCDAEISRTVVKIPALGHDYKETVINPTHKEKGYTLHTCTRCGDSYKDNETDVIAHTYDAGKVTKEATCTEDGIKTYTCSCGDIKTEVIKATGHKAGTAVRENEKAATCTTTGSYDEVVYCSVCKGEISRTKKTIPALGHDYIATVTAPTHTTKGYTTHTCTRCGDTYKDTETNVIAHTYDSGKVTKAATCTTDGVKTYTCTGCNATKTEVITKLGHDYVTTVIAPTCTTDGYTKHVCSRCGNSYNDTTVTKLGHNYVEGTCTRCGDTLPALSVSANGFTGNYDGKAHSISVTSAENTIQYSTDNKTWTTINPTFTNAGTYTVYYKVSKNGYKTVTGNQKVVINKIASTLNTAPTAKTGLVYTGSAQPLVNAGSATNGTVQYSLDNKTWSDSIPTGINVNTYTIYYKVVPINNNYIGTDSANIKVSINKGNGYINTKPTTKSLTFTGSSQQLVTAGNNASGTIQYKLGNGSYSTSIPTAVNAGNYDVYYKVLESTSYKAVPEQKITVTINKKPATISKTPTVKNGLTYTGSTLQLINAGSATNGTMQYKLGKGSYSTSIPSVTNAGTYDIYYKVIGNTNYADVAEQKLTVTVAKKAGYINTKPTGKTLAYNGNNQNLITAGSNASGTIQYSLDNKTWQTTIPQGKDVKTYTIYYKVDTSTNFNAVGASSIKATINKGNSTISTTPSAKTLTFNNADQALINAGAANNGTMQYKLNSNGTYGTSIPKAKNAGTYTVYYKVVGNTNYNDVAEKSINVTIKKATGSVTAPTAKTGLVYTGSAQTLINAGSSSTGTIQYKLGTGSYSTSLPTATNVGTYTIYYKVVGNTNYNDVAEKSIKVTIDEKSYKVTFNVNGGNALTTNTMMVKHNSTYGTLPTPTRNNYEFLGWYTAKSGGTKITSSSTYTNNADQILYAQWKEILYYSSGKAGFYDDKTGKQIYSWEECKSRWMSSDGTFKMSSNGSIVDGKLILGDDVLTLDEVWHATSIYISKSVKTIKDNFYSSNRGKVLKEIKVNASNQYFSDVDGVLYDKNKTKIILYPCRKEATSYTVVSTAKYMGTSAFWWAELDTLNIGNNMTEISQWAFRNTRIKTLNIPSTVTEINSVAFLNTFANSINVNTNNAKFCSADGVLFDKNKTRLIKYPVLNSRTSYSVPNTVKTIETWAFDGASALKTLNLSNSLTTIRNGALDSCTSLTSLTIPASVTSIGNRYDLDNLTSVKFEVTTGWKYKNVAVSSSDLANPSKAATIFKSTHASDYLSRR